MNPQNDPCGGCGHLHIDPCACFSGPPKACGDPHAENGVRDDARAPWDSQAQAPGFQLRTYGTTPVQKPRGGLDPCKFSRSHALSTRSGRVSAPKQRSSGRVWARGGEGQACAGGRFCTGGANGEDSDHFLIELSVGFGCHARGRRGRSVGNLPPKIGRLHAICMYMILKFCVHSVLQFGRF